MAAMLSQLRSQGRCKSLFYYQPVVYVAGSARSNRTKTYYHSSSISQKLTVHIPFSNDIWFKKAFEHLKQNPHNVPPPGQSSAKRNSVSENKNARQSQVSMDFDLGSQLPAFFTGP